MPHHYRGLADSRYLDSCVDLLRPVTMMAPNPRHSHLPLCGHYWCTHRGPYLSLWRSTNCRSSLPGIVTQPLGWQLANYVVRGGACPWCFTLNPLYLSIFAVHVSYRLPTCDFVSFGLCGPLLVPQSGHLVLHGSLSPYHHLVELLSHSRCGSRCSGVLWVGLLHFCCEDCDVWLQEGRFSVILYFVIVV